MNQDGQTICLQLEARKNLLTTLDTTGKFVVHDEATQLCVGEVHGCPALVPVEHATFYTMKTLQTAAMRSVDLGKLTPMGMIVADELARLDTEYAWVKECATGARP